MLYFNTPYTFYLLRSTTFSVNEIFNLNELLGEKDILECQDTLKTVFSNNLFREAIFLSSRELYVSLENWLANKIVDKNKIEDLLVSLHKYYSRMCTRCTPYGLLAGCSNGITKVGTTDISFKNRELFRSSRLDMGFLGQIIRQLETLPDVSNSIKYAPNTSIYTMGNKYRFVEYEYNKTARQYKLSSLSKSKYLDLVYQESRKGITKSDIKVILEKASSGSLTTNRINAFIESLIEYQFLVSEIDLRVTGEPHGDFVVQKLSSLNNPIEQVHRLALIQDLLNNHNTGLETYLQVEKEAKLLTDKKSASLVQTDLFFQTTNYCNETVISEITKIGEELNTIAEPYPLPALDEFKREFLARYDQQDVPFALVLDAEMGIGYGNAKNGNIEELPLIRGLKLPVVPAKSEGNVLQKLKLNKYKEHCTNGFFAVQITEEELKTIANTKKNKFQYMPTSCFIMGNILSSSNDAVDNGSYTFLASNINTPFAGKLPARFALGNRILSENIEQCLKDEQLVNPDAILAEILHIPDDRLCNISVRPLLRKYEIPYLCNPSVEEEGIISIDDLYLRLRGDKIILFSKRLGKEILPRLTNAHNSVTSISSYRFLCDLQYQHLVSGFNWEWNELETEPFLPRVTYKKFIVSRARWLLQRLSIHEQKIVKKDISDCIKKIQQTFKIGRYVLIKEYDNELALDLNNSVCRYHLFQKLKRQKVILVENLATPDNCFIEDDFGDKFSNEIIIPIKRAQPSLSGNSVTQQSLACAAGSDLMIERDFMPGSEWLYIKIYAGNKTLEHVLVDVILPIAGSAQFSGLIDKWFFLKYGDPGSHLRVRFHSVNNKSLNERVLNELYDKLNPLLKNQSVHRISLDTYNQEIERYGWQTIELSEAIFFADSIAIGNVVKHVLATKDEQMRWLAGAFSIDNMLNSFGYDIKEKQQIILNMKKAFFSEFNLNMEENESELLWSLNDKYRVDGTHLATLFSKEKVSLEMNIVIEIFQNRKHDIEDTVRKIKSIIELHDNKLIELESLVTSYVHMSLNRLFITKQRNHELVIYHYLYKHYTTVIKKTESFV